MDDKFFHYLCSVQKLASINLECVSCFSRTLLPLNYFCPKYSLITIIVVTINVNFECFHNNNYYFNYSQRKRERERSVENIGLDLVKMHGK